jgi:hypothetical protein
MKKSAIILWVIIAFSLTALLAGCGGGGSTTTSSKPAASTTPPTTSTSTTTSSTSTTPAGSKPAATSTTSTTSKPSTTTSSGNDLNDVLAKVAGIGSVKYDSVITVTGTPPITQKVYLEKTRMRIETNMQGMDTIIMIDTDKKTMYNYIPSQNMAMKMDFSQAPTPATKEVDGINQYSPQIVGTETLDGKVCLVVQYTSPQGTYKQWIWKDKGFPIKIETTSAAGNSVVENKNIEFGDIPDNLFELPAGVQITDLGSLIPTNLPTGIPTGLPK